ncbi:hypothetical protein MMG94_02970 [Methylocystis parvus OBBP]|uniref:hypothetical protein n=1 Tax=Methylocystis parvus TaxID=134 RepID=UPI0012B29D8E|nr:hypothetical protein [Methylocystis parvus]WBK00705.1 hypothetical protein MMG94_02970 [Methylocystis parvus OBBP]
MAALKNIRPRRAVDARSPGDVFHVKTPCGAVAKQRRLDQAPSDGVSGAATFTFRGARFLAGAFLAVFLVARFLVATFFVAPRFFVATLRTALRAVFFVAALRVLFLAAVFFVARFFVAAFLVAVLRVPFFAAAFLAGLRFVVALAIISPLDPNCRNMVDRQYAQIA